LIKKYNYYEKKICSSFPFKVKDVLFTSILYVANRYLKEIANIIEEDTKEIDIWISKTEKNFYKYFVINQRIWY
jgi:hypothetical protein